MNHMLQWWIGAILLITNAVSEKVESKPQWPPKEEICSLSDKLDGDVQLPGDPEYDSLRAMKNTYWTTKPGIIIRAKSAGDVRKALELARNYTLRPTVSSSGHDYIGRSTAENSLHIDLSSMTKMTINKNDPESDTGASAVFETGCTWGPVYKRLNDEGFLAAGGSCPTVALGGYLLGGGHSPMTRNLGLGVDNVMGITMVMPDGRTVYVDSAGVHSIDNPSDPVEPDHDLLWALLGGGGGNLGVVLSFKVKLHRPPTGFTLMFISFAMKHPTCGDIGFDVLKTAHNWYHDNLDDHKLGGYILFNNLPGEYQGVRYTGSITLSILYAGPREEATPVFEPMFNYKTECFPVKYIVDVPKFWDYQKEINDPTGYPLYMINRLIQKDDLKDDAFTKLVTKDIFDHTLMSCTGILIGGKGNNETGNPASVSPYFRSGVSSLACSTGCWTNEGDAKGAIDKLQTFAKEFNKYGKGMYYNEPDYYAKDWKELYWGNMDRYDRLLKAKQYWDPEGMFWCHNCVGSDINNPWSLDKLSGEKPTAELCGRDVHTNEPPKTNPDVCGKGRSMHMSNVILMLLSFCLLHFYK